MYPVSRILSRARVLFGPRRAILDGTRTYTYAQLGDRVDRLAGALLGLGLQRGDRVALLDHNTHRYLEAYYACAHAGLILMPLNTRLAPAEIEHVLNDSEARAMLFSQPFAEMYEMARKSAGSLEFGIGMELSAVPAGVVDYEACLDAATPLREAAETAADDIILIYYTSGTTGEPKGVCLTNRNMFAGAMDPLMVLGITQLDVHLHAGPLFHLATSWAVFSMPVVGAQQITMRFEPLAAMELIERERVTLTALPGAILAMMAEMPEIGMRDLSSLRNIIYGGAPTTMGVLRRAAAALPPALLHVYGITETAGYVTLLPPHEHVFEGPETAVQRTASAGQAVPLIDVRIFDDDGSELGPGEVGEIVCRGPKIMKEYWRKPKQTAEVLRNGWYHTGDMGYLDEQHYLFVVDRKKDMIISGGENVYSVEVESVLSTHPGVLEVAVIGLPDDKWGEAVVGVIVPRPGADLKPEDLVEHCRGKIGGYKIPRRFEFQNEPLPKTGPGKVAKRRLRDIYIAG